MITKIYNRGNKPKIQEDLIFVPDYKGEPWLLQIVDVYGRLSPHQKLSSADPLGKMPEMEGFLYSEYYLVVKNKADKIFYTYCDYATCDADSFLEYGIKDKYEYDIKSSEFWNEDYHENIHKYLERYKHPEELEVNFSGRCSLQEIEDFFKKCQQKIKAPELNPAYINLKAFVIDNIKLDLKHGDEITFDYQSLGEDKYIKLLELINF